jgi:superfamily I DNA and RNA helicase
MDFIPVLDTYESDAEAVWAWQRLAEVVKEQDGLCFYKHPGFGTTATNSPELVILSQGFQPMVVRCLRTPLEDIRAISDDVWEFRGQAADSPALELDDLCTRLRHRFEGHRQLRDVFRPMGILAAPHVGRAALFSTLGPQPFEVLGADGSLRPSPLDKPLSADQWALAKSIFTAAHVMRPRAVASSLPRATSMGEAVRVLDRQIALLDSDQVRAALQIAPGPQRLRGLAGTGKTVILAMRAALIHQNNPQARVLVTFHTQSLYNQMRKLISGFYRENAQDEPDWSFLHIRHAWGGKERPGVYSELCNRLGLIPLSLRSARTADRQDPFRACCREVLASQRIAPYYDYVLVDEAQDLPDEFFQVLYALTAPPHRIYIAYDELQTLTDRDPRDTSDMFGIDSAGNPRVSLDGVYGSGIEKDFVLNKSYRCPLNVLMLAHGLGLAIHGPRGPIQMFNNVASWRAMGYVLESGSLTTGSDVAIRRPAENSPNPLAQVYDGGEPIILAQAFPTITDEVNWVADDVKRCVEEQRLSPENIVVVCFQQNHWKDYLLPLQFRLIEAHGVPSVIPGLIGDSAEFAEQGHVTLATVFRAKGNELPLVYIVGFEELHSFAEEIESRNKAFTSISRTKGWVRISGSGPRMQPVKQEIERVLADLPAFRFRFPDMERIPRRLDASETTRRREAVKVAASAVDDLISIDTDAFADLDQERKQALIAKLLGSMDRKP